MTGAALWPRVSELSDVLIIAATELTLAAPLHQMINLSFRSILAMLLFQRRRRLCAVSAGEQWARLRGPGTLPKLLLQLSRQGEWPISIGESHLASVVRAPLSNGRLFLQPTPGVFTATLPHNLDFVSMLFSGSGSQLISDLTGVSPPATALLGYNEPNNPIQVSPASSSSLGSWLSCPAHSLRTRHFVGVLVNYHMLPAVCCLSVCYSLRDEHARAIALVQADMTPAQAVKIWPELEAAAKAFNIPVGSAACATCFSCAACQRTAPFRG